VSIEPAQGDDIEIRYAVMGGERFGKMVDRDAFKKGRIAFRGILQQ